jgi:hypothetical protein
LVKAIVLDFQNQKIAVRLRRLNFRSRTTSCDPNAVDCQVFFEVYQTNIFKLINFTIYMDLLPTFSTPYTTRARVQLRVMATGRVVTDRRSGSVGQPVWFAKRRLTKTLGDVKQPHGAWLGLHDRNALPTAERIAQAQLDKKESQFRVALERRPAHVVPGSKWTAAVDIGDGRIVDIVALRNSTDGPIATVVLSNGRAVEVGGSRYERITKLARHLSPDVQRARAHHAPDWIV